ncbi:unnamed protein product [Owenia fusiformis]|uniref:Ferritin n=1 Tax=Owenia fusiformis TaxID=6347 RepID=A0A8J1XGT1_OWEFU|nr:unnamed protein product [Owenia fusiformis]
MKVFPVVAILGLTLMSCMGNRHNQVNDEDESESNDASVCDGPYGVCQNYHESVADEINAQITREMEASYTYQAMANHFSRHDFALPGFAKKFQGMSDEEREHAQKLMAYQTKRGGVVRLSNVMAPSRQNWKTALNAMKDCLKLEHVVNAHLLRIHDVAATRNDPHFQDYLESEFLTEQVDSIKELADIVNKLESFKRDGNLALGTHIMDKEFQ